MPFAKGTLVQQVTPAVVDWTVEGYSVDQETGAVLNLCSYTDEDGDVHSRYFSDAELVAAS
jgi:hypothetical protein